MSNLVASLQDGCRAGTAWFSRSRLAAMALLVAALVVVGESDTDARGGQQWFTAWGSRAYRGLRPIGKSQPA